MNDDPVVREFAVAPTMPFVPVFAVVSHESNLGWRDDKAAIGHGFR